MAACLALTIREGGREEPSMPVAAELAKAG
jgi:hypothetical protein